MPADAPPVRMAAPMAARTAASTRASKSATSIRINSRFPMVGIWFVLLFMYVAYMSYLALLYSVEKIDAKLLILRQYDAKSRTLVKFRNSVKCKEEA